MSSYNEEQKIRGWIQQILVEDQQSSQLNEYGQSPEAMRKAFIDPFTNVLKVTKVAFKDILTSAKFTFDILVTFSPKKLHELRQNYAERQKRIKEEYKEVLKPVMEVLDSPDVKMATFLFNPGLYLARGVANAGIKESSELGDFFREAGFGGAPSKREKEEAGGKIKKPKGITKTVFDAIRGLFFMGPIENVDRPDLSILLEQEEEQNPANMVDMIVGALEDTGALATINTGAEELKKAAQEGVNEIVNTFGPNQEIIEKIGSAENMDELLLALEDAKVAGFDLGGSSPDALKKELEDQVDAFLNDPKAKDEFIRSMAKEEGMEVLKGEEPPPIDETKLREQITKSIFINTSASIREAMEESKEAVMDQVLEELNAFAEELGIDAEGQDAIGKTPTGRQFLQIFADAREKLQ